MTLTRKTPPYAHTTVHPYKTQGQINALFMKYGINKFQWTLDLENNQIQLIFEVDFEENGEMKKRLIKVSPSLFLEKRRTYNKITGKHTIEMAPNLAASMRMLYNWLKGRLEAVTFGLFSTESEFLSQVVINRKGETIGDMVKPQLESGKELNMEALPS